MSFSNVLGVQIRLSSERSGCCIEMRRKGAPGFREEELLSEMNGVFYETPKKVFGEKDEKRRLFTKRQKVFGQRRFSTP